MRFFSGGDPVNPKDKDLLEEAYKIQEESRMEEENAQGQPFGKLFHVAFESARKEPLCEVFGMDQQEIPR